MKTVAIELVETLRDLGVQHVFGVPSGGWVDYMEALRVTEGIEFVLATHEGGAAFMADVAGRLSGAPGVCFGTFGPGATNLATGVGGALLDRSPVIALTDEMPDGMRGRVTQMGIDHQALFAPLTKATGRLCATGVAQTIQKAAAIALTERPGPVHLGLPVGLSVETATAGAGALHESSIQDDPDQQLLHTAVARLQQAKRPLLALGLAAARHRCGAQVIAFAEALQAPVVLTPMAKGLIPEDHPLYAGVLFHALSDRVVETCREADLVLALGYDPVEFNLEQWLPAVPLINVDTAPLDIDTSRYPDALDITGPLSASLSVLLQAALPIADWQLEVLASRREAMFQGLRSAAGTFGPCAALEVIREWLPEEGIMACDVGAHTHLIGQKWPTPAVGRQVMTNGWSAMGFGVPAAIAAKLCRPDAPVCAVVGDGGFLMTAGELAVAVRLQLDIVFVVFSDNDLALIRIKQEKKHHPAYGTRVRERGTIGGDKLFGVPVLVADNAEHFQRQLASAQAIPGPVIVEAIMDSREYDELVLRPQ